MAFFHNLIALRVSVDLIHLLQFENFFHPHGLGHFQRFDISFACGGLVRFDRLAHFGNFWAIFTVFSHFDSHGYLRSFARFDNLIVLTRF